MGLPSPGWQNGEDVMIDKTMPQQQQQQQQPEQGPAPSPERGRPARRSAGSQHVLEARSVSPALRSGDDNAAPSPPPAGRQPPSPPGQPPSPPAGAREAASPTAHPAHHARQGRAPRPTPPAAARDGTPPVPCRGAGLSLLFRAAPQQPPPAPGMPFDQQPQHSPPPALPPSPGCQDEEISRLRRELERLRAVEAAAAEKAKDPSKFTPTPPPRQRPSQSSGSSPRYRILLESRAVQTSPGTSPTPPPGDPPPGACGAACALLSQAPPGEREVQQIPPPEALWAVPPEAESSGTRARRPPSARRSRPAPLDFSPSSKAEGAGPPAAAAPAQSGSPGAERPAPHGPGGAAGDAGEQQRVSPESAQRWAALVLERCPPDPHFAHPNRPAVLLPGLCFGSAKAARNIDALKAVRVRRVVNCVPTQCPAPLAYQLKDIEVMNVPEGSASELLRQAAAVSDYAQGDGATYVHCSQGVDRSAALAIALLMLWERLPLLQAVRKAHNVRPIILQDSPDYIRALIEFAAAEDLLGGQPSGLQATPMPEMRSSMLQESHPGSPADSLPASLNGTPVVPPATPSVPLWADNAGRAEAVCALCRAMRRLRRSRGEAGLAEVAAALETLGGVDATEVPTPEAVDAALEPFSKGTSELRRCAAEQMSGAATVLRMLRSGLRLEALNAATAGVSGDAADASAQPVFLRAAALYAVTQGDLPSKRLARPGGGRSIPVEPVTEKILEGWMTRTCEKWELLPQNEMVQLLCHARAVFSTEENLVLVPAPVNVVGDIHGQFWDLLQNVIGRCGQPGPDNYYLFLGDIVDRGPHSLLCLTLLLLLKVRFPRYVYILRGNHEACIPSDMYGFHEECRRSFGDAGGNSAFNISGMWGLCCSVFNSMPLSALCGGAIFCCHGGLSPKLRSWEEVLCVSRDCDIDQTCEGPQADLTWSDPQEDVDDFTPNIRGLGCIFGRDQAAAFLKRGGLQFIVRAHQCVRSGFAWGLDRKCLTVFSAPNYVGQGNKGAVLRITADLEVEAAVYGSAEALGPVPNPAGAAPDYFNADSGTREPHMPTPIVASATADILNSKRQPEHIEDSLGDAS
eukprot:TRINITY_DN7776_c0_g1_i1.p1 TRINITY_DN7776_c0_g1~~TRINITY_DN7776_c0_g1_i1.p1  ORF type:complete len:1205 (+),score=292.31 TRINITY_DN7776_c0_g1_i1:366-3617(+)